MTAVKLKSISLEKIKEKSSAIFQEVKKNVPMGLGNANSLENISSETKEKYKKLLENYKKRPHNKEILHFLEKGKAINNLGSLGHGNHFLELSTSNNKDVWLVVHSGSRAVGHKVAEIYMKKSSNNETNFEQTFPLSVKSEIGQEYLNVLDFCLEFALLNRLEMIKSAVKSIEHVLNKKIQFSVWVNKNHNHAIKQGKFYIHRKGATPAKKNEKGVIPANMRDGSILVKGLGNKKFLESSSHGAGRILSRSQAHKTLNLQKVKEQMKDIVSDINPNILDEAPEAYKNINQVMDAQKQSVKQLKTLKPIINWKGQHHIKR
jgi:tRNA-splicing ligase RtcB